MTPGALRGGCRHSLAIGWLVLLAASSARAQPDEHEHPGSATLSPEDGHEVPSGTLSPRSGGRAGWGGFWGNDLWADPPPADDSGFTNDLGLQFRHLLGERDTVDVQLRHRMITERFGRRRWDQVDATAGFDRTFTHRDLALIAGPRLGAGFGGNFGGRALQNAWHRYTASGPTLDDGLQDTYDGDRRAALLLGAHVGGSARIGIVTPYAAADAQAALGPTGVSFIELAAGTRVEPRVGRRARLVLGLELAAARFSADDPNLQLAGAYDTTGWQGAWRLTLGITLRRWQFAWQYRSSEGGSGEPFGLLGFRSGGP